MAAHSLCLLNIYSVRRLLSFTGTQEQPAGPPQDVVFGVKTYLLILPVLLLKAKHCLSSGETLYCMGSGALPDAPGCLCPGQEFQTLMKH